MGISAQQHRVSIGLFYNSISSYNLCTTNKVNVCPCRDRGDVGYTICYSILGIQYFYILLYAMILDSLCFTLLPSNQANAGSAKFDKIIFLT